MYPIVGRVLISAEFAINIVLQYHHGIYSGYLHVSFVLEIDYDGENC